MRKIRLPENVYRIKNQACSITICANDNINILSNREFTRYCISILKELAEKNDIELQAFCFMPDHIHFIISVQGDKSIIDFIRKFKSITTVKSRQFGFKGSLYQKRFYDHFIREDEGLNETIMYVLNNPVRKGFVDKWEDFPYSEYCAEEQS
ncbi:MAG: transposase [candidate division Zixibacteria bacterium]|nr:transposase [candidate division Zixibacteria bacterium]